MRQHHMSKAKYLNIQNYIQYLKKEKEMICHYSMFYLVVHTLLQFFISPFCICRAPSTSPRTSSPPGTSASSRGRSSGRAYWPCTRMRCAAASSRAGGPCLRILASVSARATSTRDITSPASFPSISSHVFASRLLSYIVSCPARCRSRTAARWSSTPSRTSPRAYRSSTRTSSYDPRPPYLRHYQRHVFSTCTYYHPSLYNRLFLH